MYIVSSNDDWLQICFKFIHSYIVYFQKPVSLHSLLILFFITNLLCFPFFAVWWQLTALCTLYPTKYPSCPTFGVSAVFLSHFFFHFKFLCLILLQDSLVCTRSGVSRMAYPRGANRGRSFGAPGQIEEWRPSAEVLDGGRAVASLTVPGGQEVHFPHFFL